ncbi:uncharacterized protein LOC110938729 [Helianthus annuus]|uniref:uncharacterized protein LOC110938729 n=1 Tax=Helianthus annuus TaxID=4232 RepID=UPI000B8F1737|nr:uncharacterized protein LOC110938729 [Helianthus annuus]
MAEELCGGSSTVSDGRGQRWQRLWSFSGYISAWVSAHSGSVKPSQNRSAVVSFDSGYKEQGSVTGDTGFVAVRILLWFGSTVKISQLVNGFGSVNSFGSAPVWSDDSVQLTRSKRVNSVKPGQLSESTRSTQTVKLGQLRSNSVNTRHGKVLMTRVSV